MLPLALWPEGDERAWGPGAASRWWYWHSLAALQADLERRGSRLVVAEGAAGEAVPRLALEAGAAAVAWAAGLDPSERDDDETVAVALRGAGIEATIVPSANLLREPGRLRTKDGRPYTVFTPFWRALLGRLRVDAPLPPPKTLPAAPRRPAGTALRELRPRAVRPWAAGFDPVWTPGEQGARAQLERFLDDALELYADDRDRPDLAGTSRLSPHLHWGELTARQTWRAVHDRLSEQGLDLEAAVAPASHDDSKAPRRSAGAFLRQLGWREFGQDLLHHFPAMPDEPLHERFAAMPWRDDPEALAAWRRGRTGVPFVDAGMRQLWATGWLHNRARLVTASFLTKHLLLPWQAGEAWYWDTLVDADLGNNALGWQWVAGSGADAAPYFRVMNPVLQGQRFDADGAYVRAWVPELGRVPAAHIHAPWLAPAAVLAEAGVELGRDYPFPIVDLAEGRARALAAYEAVKRARR
jgi:deoxyribodipyrimidine photo-lyase